MDHFKFKPFTNNMDGLYCVCTLFLLSTLTAVQAQLTLNPNTEEDVKLSVLNKHTVNVATTQCYLSQQNFLAQYINEVDSVDVYDVNNITGSVNRTQDECTDGGSRYLGTIHLKFLNNPELVGKSFRLKITNINNGMTVTSRGTFTFPAPLNLTGSSEYAILNTTFTWRCTIPSTSVFIKWFRNKTELGRFNVLSNGTCNKVSPNETYQYDCQQQTFTLTIPASVVTQNEQGSLWRCQDVFSVEKGSRYGTLNITVPVSTVTISPGSGTTIDGNENQTITFTCTVNNNVNPPPTIQWSIGSTNITNMAGPDTSTLSLTIRRSHHNKSLKCTAWNTGNEKPLNDSKILNVKYPPASTETLQITGYTNGQVLYENNSTFTIYCRQSGGNPLVNITLTCASDTETNENTATEAIRKVTLKQDRDLNNQRCDCVSTHIEGYRQSTSVTFTVYYPPSNPTITTSKPYPWKALSTGHLTCNTVVGNPVGTTYKWKEGSTEINSSQTYVLASLQPEDNGRQLICQVSNAFTVNQNVLLQSPVTTLHIEYDPIVTLQRNSIEVIEGDGISVNCSATGNPAPNVTWYRNSTPVTSTSISSSTYRISNASREQTGNYTCKAMSSSSGSNTLNPDQKQLQLQVLYPPSVSVKLQNTTEGLTNQMINCTADGIPDNTTIMKLEQKYLSLSVRNITQFTTMNTRLGIYIIETVSYQDTGTYICSASNGIPDRQKRQIKQGSAYMDVKASAQFTDMEYPIQGELHVPVSAQIPFYSNPKASVSGLQLKLRNGSSTLPVKESLGIRLSLVDVNVVRNFHGVDVTLPGQSVVINISSFEESDTGNYSLIVNNSDSLTAEMRIVITPSGPPETPTNLTARASSVSNIFVSWIKGSNGGHQQTFVILYNEMNSEVTMNKSFIDDFDKDTRNITQEITDLKDDTEYQLQLYAYNRKGNSSFTNVVKVKTLKKQAESTTDEQNSSALVGGVAGAGAGILVIILIVAVVLYRRHASTLGKDSEFGNNTRSNLTAENKDDSYDDGLRDNPLYASSQQAQAEPSTEQGDPNLYASVVKPKTKNKPEVSNEPPPIYAEVDKLKKNLHDKDKKKNKKDKGKENKKKPANNMDNEVYENVGEPKANGVTADGKPQKDEAEKNEERGYRNQDGLLYVDVKFDTQPPRGRPVIRGEERTGYAMIEFEEPQNQNAHDEVLGAEGGQQNSENKM